MDSDTTRKRAMESGGFSTEPKLYQVVREYILSRTHDRRLLVDLGCGSGALFKTVGTEFADYVGVDIVRYEAFPVGQHVKLVLGDLDTGRSPLRDSCADVVCSIEAIARVNRVFRDKPGGLVVVTTPNQLTLASKLSLVLKNEFIHFQERPGLYPSHLTALLEIDLLRMARENGLDDMEAVYTGCGRIPLSAAQWPRFLTARRGRRGRAFSDNVILLARKPSTQR